MIALKPLWKWIHWAASYFLAEFLRVSRLNHPYLILRTCCWFLPSQDLEKDCLCDAESKSVIEFSGRFAVTGTFSSFSFDSDRNSSQSSPPCTPAPVTSTVLAPRCLYKDLDKVMYMLGLNIIRLKRFRAACRTSQNGLNVKIAVEVWRGHRSSLQIGGRVGWFTTTNIQHHIEAKITVHLFL